MQEKKSYVPLKLFFGYAVFAALLTAVTILLFSENAAFTTTEQKIATENAKLLRINSLLSKVYEAESFSRIAIQSASQDDYNQYTQHTTNVITQIDSLKTLVNSEVQIQLLDSVAGLLTTKKANIDALRDIKQKAGKEVGVTNAINELARMQHSLRKLELEDFVKDPSTLGAYQRSVLTKYVDYLNQNIPDDETNTLSQKVLDSMLVASKLLLNDVRKETAKRNALLSSQEKMLLDKELLVSSQLQKILSEIEREIVVNSERNDTAKTTALNRIIKIVTWSAVIGLALSFFFSLLILNDFLKTKKYKKWLEIANSRTSALLRNREQLISTVSHDLKTPLSTISGYAELLSHAELTPKQQYYNSNIKSASDYISHLVQDLLDFTQLEAGKITIDEMAFSLPQMLKEVSESVATMHAKPIRLEVKWNPIFESSILGDPFRLRQILTNLIGNAFKFTAQGTIIVNAVVDDEQLKIHVQDSGIGIAKENLSRIFDEFTQADNSIEKRFGGTGLGLTISRKIAEILGGSLSVESSQGNGSTFTVLLPLRLAPTNTKTQRQLRIAVVDDDVNLLQLTSETLRQQHSVLSYSSADQALQDSELQFCDVIVTDLQMPETDGIGLLAKLRQTSWFKSPIIAVTGKMDISESELRSLGFTAVIRKPYAQKQLLDVVIRVAERQDVEVTIGNDYRLEQLNTFFPDDPATLKNIISIFLGDATKNMTLLEAAIIDQNREQVIHLAHKMGPMFRQLGLIVCGDLLHKLELGELTSIQMQTIFDDLKPEVDKALKELGMLIV